MISGNTISVIWFEAHHHQLSAHVIVKHEPIMSDYFLTSSQIIETYN